LRDSCSVRTTGRGGGTRGELEACGGSGLHGRPPALRQMFATCVGEFMRLPVILLGFAYVFSTAALGEDDCRCWTPSAEDIATVETKIAERPLPLGSLDRYARYYVGTIESDRRIRRIQGKLVPVSDNEPPGVHILEGSIPPLQGEGCIAQTGPEVGSGLALRCVRPHSISISISSINHN
jgi:hypothetical protein